MSCDHLRLPHLQLPNLLNNSRPREVKQLVPGHPALWLGTYSQAGSVGGIAEEKVTLPHPLHDRLSLSQVDREEWQ